MEFLVSKISRRKLDTLIKEYGTNEKTLEIGAYGNPTYGRYFPNRIGVDIRAGKGVDTVASVYELPFRDGEFDTVLCMSVLEHLEEPRRAITEMRRVLKDGGKIIISVPFMFPIHDAPGDYWRFTKFGLRKLFADGWQIERLVAETNTAEAFAVLLQRLGYQTVLQVNMFSKFLLFLIARIVAGMNWMVIRVYGGITKKQEEPEAFASSFFLVARKISTH